MFQPHLEKVLELKRRYVTFFPPAAHPYDVLLDEFEPGMTTADVREVFDVLRPRQVELIRALARTSAGGRRILRRVLRRAGDVELRRRGRSPHSASTGRAAGRTSRCIRSPPPSARTTCASRRDGSKGSRSHCSSGRCTRPGTVSTNRASAARTTARRSKAAPRSACTSRRAACGKTSSAGRVRSGSISSRRCRRAFRRSSARVTLEQFYRGINRVRPSLIRVEADEATYNLHVMLRVELEIALLEGRDRGARSARCLARAHAGVPRPHAARRRDRRAAGHPLVGGPVRLLRHLHARQHHRRAALGDVRARAPGSRRADPPRRLLLAPRVAAPAKCTSTGASTSRRSWCSGSPAHASTRLRICAIWRRSIRTWYGRQV